MYLYWRIRDSKKWSTKQQVCNRIAVPPPTHLEYISLKRSQLVVSSNFGLRVAGAPAKRRKNEGKYGCGRALCLVRGEEEISYYSLSYTSFLFSSGQRW